MKDQLKLCDMMWENIRKSVQKFMDDAPNRSSYYWGHGYMNSDYGRVAIRRKITWLRQELLNLERMLDSVR